MEMVSPFWNLTTGRPSGELMASRKALGEVVSLMVMVLWLVALAARVGKCRVNGGLWAILGQC